MGRSALWTLILGLISPASVLAQTSSEAVRSFEIRRSYETSSKRGDEGSGSSSGHDTIVERLIAQRDGGVELEFDHPAATSKADRARDWQFPVRVFRSREGSINLVDQSAVEKRIATWLKKAKIPRRACGTWYFTWNAFKVECDPQTVLKTVAGFDIRIDGARAGSLYKAEGAVEAVPLRDEKTTSGDARLAARLSLDPDDWRRSEVESALVVAQVMRKPLTRDEAVVKLSKDRVSGTINVTFDFRGSSSEAIRRTTITQLEVRRNDGFVEQRNAKEIIERTPLQ